MKSQHQPEYKSATDGLTEAQIERARERSEHGRLLGLKMGHGIIVVTKVDKKRSVVKASRYDSPDWRYYDDERAKLTSSERAAFDLAFVRARATAGVRPAVDLALSEMRRALMRRLGTPRWGAVG